MPNSDRKPRDDEIDTYGLTHTGKVRPDNQDHFLIASVHKHLNILQTDLGEDERLPFADERVAFRAMVADGVAVAWLARRRALPQWRWPRSTC